jgi:hypothetical protein
MTRELASNDIPGEMIVPRTCTPAIEVCIDGAQVRYGCYDSALNNAQVSASLALVSFD